METKFEERCENFGAVFESILNRINEKRKKEDKYIILDSEKYKAIESYCRGYNDFVVFKD